MKAVLEFKDEDGLHFAIPSHLGVLAVPRLGPMGPWETKNTVPDPPLSNPAVLFHPKPFPPISQCSEQDTPAVLRVEPGCTTNRTLSSPGENFARR